MSHALPVTVCQVKFQEAKEQMQKILRPEYVDNFNN